MCAEDVSRDSGNDHQAVIGDADQSDKKKLATGQDQVKQQLEVG